MKYLPKQFTVSVYERCTYDGTINPNGEFVLFAAKAEDGSGLGCSGIMHRGLALYLRDRLTETFDKKE